MKKNEVLTVNDAVHKLQLYLLDGIKHENQLSAAGSLMCRSDYQDVVTERTIAKMCGYPLCSNSLPSERPWKGRYHISLKEHKVYDLQETYMYCSTDCAINSQAFSASLLEERISTLKPAKLNEVLKMFDRLGLESPVDMGKDGDLGLSDLKIQEKVDVKAGEVSLEEWIGSSNAIDGYVPRGDRKELQKASNRREVAKQKKLEFEDRNDIADILANDMNFTSTIIIPDEYSVSKTVAPSKNKEPKGKDSSEDAKRLGKTVQTAVTPSTKVPKSKTKKLTDAAGPSQNGTPKEETELQSERQSAAGPVLKSSLRTSLSKKENRSVTWADEITDSDGQNLVKLKNGKEGLTKSHSMDDKVDEQSYRFASAEACARALSEAAEAVASGKSDASDAVSEAGVIILLPPEENGDMEDTDPVKLKWPPKPGVSNGDDLLDSEDSWYDSPPDGFNLTLSPFSTMFMAIFAWISSSSLAYIYGREENFHEEYLFVSGREYPQKIVLSDGCSSEIKQTLAGCLSRALPGLVTELRLPTPISTLEQGMARLLDTMSFTDPLPAFRMKQWQVITLLFLDALSVSRIPALTPFLMRSRTLLPKVLEGARISSEEFEIMKDLIIPLGRVPQFSTQSGG